MPETLGMPNAARKTIGAVLLTVGLLKLDQVPDQPVESTPKLAQNDETKKQIGSFVVSQAAIENGQKPGATDRFAEFNADGIPAKVNSTSKNQWKNIDVKNATIGRLMAERKGWVGNQWYDLLELWACESSWDEELGIPQAKPAEKMASEGDDWRTNPETQIRWGLKYILNRPDYGSPSRALAHFKRYNWY